MIRFFLSLSLSSLMTKQQASSSSCNYSLTDTILNNDYLMFNVVLFFFSLSRENYLIQASSSCIISFIFNLFVPLLVILTRREGVGSCRDNNNNNNKRTIWSRCTYYIVLILIFLLTCVILLYNVIISYFKI